MTVSQSCVVDVGYLTTNLYIVLEKLGQKYYSHDAFFNALMEANFPDYSKSNDINEAYNDGNSDLSISECPIF